MRTRFARLILFATTAAISSAQCYQFSGGGAEH